MFNEYYRWGILGAWIWVGIGCADSTSQVVDDKLAHITHEERMAISEPVPIPLSVPMIYQQGKDPFINPYRNVEVLDTNHAADQQDEPKPNLPKLGLWQTLCHLSHLILISLPRLRHKSSKAIR